MLTLNLKNEPFDLDLGYGVTLTVRPANSAMMMAAKQRAIETERAASETADDDAADGKGTGLSFLKALGQLAIVGWQGVGDENAQPVEPSEEAIDAFFDVYQMAKRFEDRYVNPALLVGEEKKS